MPATLDQIVSATRRRVSQARHTADLRDLERRAAQHTPRGFRASLQAAATKGAAVIAELKKASPSRGLIRQHFDPLALAKELAEAGASALSVLTDEEFFQGSLENLRIASAATSLPCLRKDFIIDEFQILEARANGADAVLLIVAALQDEELQKLMRAATGTGVDVLCEVHDEEELGRCVSAGCELIGVNSRDLKTFKVDLNTALHLGSRLPRDVVGVAESGIQSGEDIARLRAAGYQAFLIGETIMSAPRPGEVLADLLANSVAASQAVRES